jgi:hypothetical protein
MASYAADRNIDLLSTIGSTAFLGSGAQRSHPVGESGHLDSLQMQRGQAARDVYPQSFPRFALQSGQVKLVGLMPRRGIAALDFGMTSTW